MERPKNCSPSFNLRRVGEPEKKIRIVCLYAYNRKLLLKLISDAGGYESSGICEAHYDYAEWWANGEPTEEERDEALRIEKMQEEAKRIANS